ncbi:unnamed protein product, partial [Brassica napus]
VAHFLRRFFFGNKGWLKGIFVELPKEVTYLLISSLGICRRLRFKSVLEILKDGASVKNESFQAILSESLTSLKSWRKSKCKEKTFICLPLLACLLRNDVKPQACIFKVGDDCRQDILALQVISLLRDIYVSAKMIVVEMFSCHVALTTKTHLRASLSLSLSKIILCVFIFQQEFGPVGSPSFEMVWGNVLTISVGYGVVSLLLQPKDRHNDNLLFDNKGRLVHIDFKIWHQFVNLCVKGYLAAHRYMEGIIITVEMMVGSGLPCFSRGDPIEKLRKRFHSEMSEREAAHFMIHVCTDFYNNWTTYVYDDLIQFMQQGIEK